MQNVLQWENAVYVKCSNTTVNADIHFKIIIYFDTELKIINRGNHSLSPL